LGLRRFKNGISLVQLWPPLGGFTIGRVSAAKQTEDRKHGTKVV
jgi:hypothetical protein